MVNSELGVGVGAPRSPTVGERPYGRSQGHSGDEEHPAEGLAAFDVGVHRGCLGQG